MKGFVQIVVGLLLFVIVAYILTYSTWLWATLELLQGGIVLLLFLIGLGFLLIGFSEVKG